jgi:O-acetylhomoserine (thiol)-lyase
VQKHSENGLALAVVRNTRSGGMGKYGLKSSKYYDLAKEYLPRTKWNCHFWFKGGFEAAKTVADETKIFSFSKHRDT